MSIENLIKDIEKAYGEGSLLRLGDRVGQPIPHIPTNIVSLDEDVLGIGGIPKGRITEIYGENSSGKTTLASTIIASSQKQMPDKFCALIDTEMSYDPNFAAKIGVNVNDLFVSQPSCGEEALDIAEKLIESGLFSVIVVDSVANLTPRVELDGEMSDQHVGVIARLMARALRKLTGIVSRTETALIFTNQVRANIGINNPYAPQTTTTGGKSLRFYASVRLSVARTGSFKEDDIIIGNKVKIKAEKNKLSPPFRETEVELNFEEGFDKYTDLIKVAIEKGKVNKSGAWLEFNKERFQGKYALKEYLKKDKNYEMLKESLRNK